jgi:hypothetical protein
METVLVLVAPEAGFDLYELVQRQFRGRGWEAMVLPVTDVATADLPPIAAVVAHATDWPEKNLHEWLAAVRERVGKRKRLLVLLPRPPASFPPETQMLWSGALGYGAKISEAVAIVDDYVAGR